MNEYYSGEKLGKLPQKKGKGKLPLFRGNGEQVNPIYGYHTFCYKRCVLACWYIFDH